MHYLITGHTGFKGAWLTLWLSSLGHKVSGIALDPITGALFETAKVADFIENDLRIDIRNANEVEGAIKTLAPDVVFHMAAQPLVRESYRDPRGTIETNVMGTLNVIEAVSATPSVKAQVVVTTDKVYRNVNQVKGYKEDDPLGGEDPYSASKAMADILSHSWISSFDGPPTAIVRAGNVIGGGDISPNRLLPDLIEAYSQGQKPILRYPESVRPWQHVLDCLNGYLDISNHLLKGVNIGEINIGPSLENFVSVKELADLVASLYETNKGWKQDKNNTLHEANLLALDASKARSELGWADKLSFHEAVNWTVNWHKEVHIKSNPREASIKQIADFLQINFP